MINWNVYLRFFFSSTCCFLQVGTDSDGDSGIDLSVKHSRRSSTNSLVPKLKKFGRESLDGKASNSNLHNQPLSLSIIGTNQSKPLDNLVDQSKPSSSSSLTPHDESSQHSSATSPKKWVLFSVLETFDVCSQYFGYWLQYIDIFLLCFIILWNCGIM